MTHSQARHHEKTRRMALIQYTGIVNDVRGKLGGTVCSRNKSGSYIKAWAKPPNKMSQPQQLSKAYLEGLAIVWNQAGQTVWTDWANFAAVPPEVDYDRWGNVCLLDGWHWFARINIRLRHLGLPTSTDVPTCGSQTIPAITSVTIGDLGGGIDSCNVKCLAGAFGNSDYCVIKLGIVPFVARQRGPTTKYIVQTWDADATTTEIDFPIGVLLAFGLIVVGWRWFIEVYREHYEAVRSLPYTANGDVTP